MNYERIGKTLQTKIRSTKSKKKNQSEIAVNKKPLARKQIFVQTPLSHSTLKIERKKTFKPQDHSLFRSTSGFGVTKITTPI